MKNIIFLCLMLTSILIINVDVSAYCGVTEQDNKVLATIACPNTPGSQYKKCITYDNRCCDAEDTISCPIQQ